MKWKLITLLFTSALIMSVTACGKEENSANTAVQQSMTEKGTEETKVEKTEEKTEENKKEELANWKGIVDHYGYRVVGKGSVSVDIKYPSLKPASSGCAYQMDPALVLIADPGLTSDMKEIWVENFEDTFSVAKNNIIMYIDNFRNYQYDNFDFVIETQELMTINELDTCKYTGKHTYTLDGVAKEIPFVAYSVDTKQVENTYPTILVMDDSINNPSMEPLPEGTIEAYAKKMVESIVVNDGTF